LSAFTYGLNDRAACLGLLLFGPGTWRHRSAAIGTIQAARRARLATCAATGRPRFVHRGPALDCGRSGHNGNCVCSGPWWGSWCGSLRRRFCPHRGSWRRGLGLRTRWLRSR
jgi:hypothetical protein